MTAGRTQMLSEDDVRDWRAVVHQVPRCLVHPHVKYCTVTWSTHYIKDEQLIEKIQRRFTKMIPGFRNKSYEKGLRILRLNTLEERRNRADLIFIFKMYKGLSRPPFESLFQLTMHDRTRGHTLKLTKHCISRNVQLHFFSERVTGITSTNPSCRRLHDWRNNMD